MLGMKNYFDISGSIEIREVDIEGVACSLVHGNLWNMCSKSRFELKKENEDLKKIFFNYSKKGRHELRPSRYQSFSLQYG